MAKMVRSFVILATGALMFAATACSSTEKAPEETAAAVAPVAELTEPAPAPVIAQNDSKTKGLWGASSTGRSR